MLLLQNNGRYFDENGNPEVNSPQNAHTIAQIVLWCNGDTLDKGGTRMAYRAAEFNNGADNDRARGTRRHLPQCGRRQ
jgi:hypothetical protein